MTPSPQSTQSTIGARLRQALGDRNMSLRTLAKATGVPYRTLQDYVADKRKPGSDHLAKMAGAGIDLNWLITGAPDRGADAATTAEGVAGDADLTEALYKRSLAAVDEYLQQDPLESMSFSVFVPIW